VTDVTTTIVCTAGVAVNIRELSRRLGKLDLDGMFTAALSATGSLPVTHYISSGLIRPAYLNAFTDDVRLFNIGKAAWEADSEVFPFTQAQVTNRLAACTVSDGTFNGGPEGPHELLVRLGLKLITSPA